MWARGACAPASASGAAAAAKASGSMFGATGGAVLGRDWSSHAPHVTDCRSAASCLVNLGESVRPQSVLRSSFFKWRRGTVFPPETGPQPYLTGGLTQRPNVTLTLLTTRSALE